MRTPTNLTILLLCALTAAPVAAQEREIHLDYVPKPAISGQPVDVIVSGVAGQCPNVTEPEQMGNLISMGFGDGCPISLPGQAPFELVQPIGPLVPGLYSVVVREFTREDAIDHTLELTVIDGTACAPSETVLCLNQGRFRLQVEWEEFGGETGVGRAVPFLADDPAGSDTGFFWFFDPLNLELMIKVLDACRFRDRFWVFVASASTVAYQITVEDTVSGEVKTYTNELGQTPALIPDTNAFATCP